MLNCLENEQGWREDLGQNTPQTRGDLERYSGECLWGPLGETSLGHIWRESCPGGATVMNLPDNARDRRDGILALALGDPLEDLLDLLYEIKITIHGNLTGGNTGCSSKILD